MHHTAKLRLAAALGLAVGLLVPVAASAHGGLVGRSDLPIPGWLFGWGASAVLIVSFVGLATLWPKPQLETPSFRSLSPALGRALTSRSMDLACSAIGLFLFGVTIWAGFAGTINVNENFAPTLVFVLFWVGMVFASALFGDVYRALNPWRAMGRLVGWSAARISPQPLPEPLPYPERLGRWPAVAGFVAFTTLELVSGSGDEPRAIVIAALVYTAAQLIGMAMYGVEAWISRGEAFSVYFNLFSRLSVFERRGREVGLRKPLSGLAQLDYVPGTVAMLMVMLGSVSFDGANGGEFFQSMVPEITDFWSSVGFNPKHALEATFATGYLGAVIAVTTLYRLGVIGATRIGKRRSAQELGGRFVHSLVPIAFAYAGAHYISLLVYQSQGAWAIFSDPLGRGWNLFGTADTTIDYSVIGATAFWYIQVALVVCGHVAGLCVAHDRALVLYERAKDSVRSQYWMLSVMIVFSSLALWLLSQQNEG